MVHFPTLNMIAIYGGRNEDLYKSNKTPILGDLYVLGLENLVWASVKMCGFTKGPRCSHIAGAFGSKMYIFGGISSFKYSTTEVSIIELDQVTASKLNKTYIEKPHPVLPEIAQYQQRVTMKPENYLTEVDLFEKYSGLLSFLPVPTKKELQEQFEEQIQQREGYSRGDIRKRLTHKDSPSKKRATVLYGSRFLRHTVKSPQITKSFIQNY